MSPRAPEPTRLAVLDAADVLLEAGGPAAVTLRAVGAEAGVSRSAPYRHFEGKADLLAAVALRTLSALGSAIRDAAGETATGAGTATDRLRRGCLGYLDYALASPQHYLLIFGSTPLADPSPAIEAATDDGLGALEELVREAQADGILPPGPLREVSTALWVFLHGLCSLQLTRHLHEPRTLDGDTRLNELLDLTLAAWRP
jgi:AcrR family transcriptional regulator